MAVFNRQAAMTHIADDFSACARRNSIFTRRTPNDGSPE
jgi:hypothetical protein